MAKKQRRPFDKCVCVCEGGRGAFSHRQCGRVRFWQRVHCGQAQIAFFRFLHLFYIFPSGCCTQPPLPETANKSTAVSPIKILQNTPIAM